MTLRDQPPATAGGSDYQRSQLRFLFNLNTDVNGVAGQLESEGAKFHFIFGSCEQNLGPGGDRCAGDPIKISLRIVMMVAKYLDMSEFISTSSELCKQRLWIANPADF